MIGDGGKYDDVCAFNCRMLEAQAVVLIVMGGVRGSGFSVSVEKDIIARGGFDNMAKVLREVADQIEADLKELKKT